MKLTTNESMSTLLIERKFSNGHRSSTSSNGFHRRLRRYIDMKGILVINLLILMVNLYSFVLRYRSGFYPDSSYFETALTPEARPILFRTLSHFTEFLDQHQFTYIIYAGTMLGAYRHKGIIPWDDDVDLLIDEKNRENIKRLIIKELPDYGLFSPENSPWKFYLQSQPKYIHKSFKYPYIDIFFYAENKTHIWENINTEYSYPRSLVFPTRLVSFDNIKLVAPCAMGKLLSRNFRVNMCRSRQFNHISELPMMTSSMRDIECEKIHHLFPFVYRHHFTDKNGVKMVNETLKINQWTLNSELLLDEC